MLRLSTSRMNVVGIGVFSLFVSVALALLVTVLASFRSTRMMIQVGAHPDVTGSCLPRSS